MRPSTDAIQIRPMRPADVSAALEVLGAWDMAPTPDRADAERSGIIVENAFVAEHDGRVIGTAGWFAISDTIAETASLAVDPDYQGLGIGYRLQQARLSSMRERGFRTVRTETDRPATIKWYIEKFDYRITGSNPKKHTFSLPDVDEWTVLEMDL